MYINKWHTFTACCLLQLLMGVQYCFSCALRSATCAGTSLLNV